VGVVVAVIFHCFFLCLPGGAFFSFNSERSEGKNGPPEDKEERQRARGKDREAGRASAKQPYRLAHGRAVPKGRPDAKRSGHHRRRKWRKDARPSASERIRAVAFGWQSQATGTGKKQAGQVWVLELIGISTQWARSGSLKWGKLGTGDLPTVSRLNSAKWCSLYDSAD
jgi:hypothetical protein